MAKQAEATVDGGVDILVNNAGITRDGLILRMKDEDWDDVLRVNLPPAFPVAGADCPMMKRRWGRIIGISSIVGATGNAGQVNYAAAKAGMVGFPNPRQEVASRGITVNVVAPGFIATAMTEALSDDQKSQLLGGIPWAGWALARTSRGRRSWPARRRAMSPARPCTSTAGWRC